MSNIELKRNNLDKSLSPYLKQHANNPIHWQEWSGKIIELATKLDKNILVSIGYSTCHWCHVMASEAFSDQAIAQYLNENYSHIEYKDPFAHDFHNLSAFISEGHWHLIHTPEKLLWHKLSLNSLKVLSNEFSDCFEEKCSPTMS